MKKNLLVTLADKNYIDQAKQLFASVYFNAGWKGDYMLLSYGVPEKELRWFKKRGILIKKCKPFIKSPTVRNPAKLCKFYIFTPEFKKWKNIVYLDADVIVRASMDELTKVKGFAAVADDLICNKLLGEFPSLSQTTDKEFKKFISKFDVLKPAFNSGVMAFNTEIIKDSTFTALKNLFNQYHQLFGYSTDQPALNLMFYKKWQELPLLYNLDARHFKFLNPNSKKTIVFHYKGITKPWRDNGPFFHEWKSNLDKANRINLSKTLPQKKWSSREIRIHSLYLKTKFFLNSTRWIPLIIDRYLGLAGFYLRCNSPWLYKKLKIIKDGKG